METEKSEITNLPEGMSSEELDKLTTGEEVEDDTLAQEALDATASDEESTPAEESVTEDETKTEEESSEEQEKKKPDESEVDPKDAVIGDFRRKNRDLELEKAKLEGELEARKSIATTTKDPEKSPLELAEEAYIKADIEAGGEGDLDGFAMSGELYRKQKAFDDKQIAEKATADNQQQVNTAAVQVESELQEGELSAEKMGQGLDLQTVAGIGTQYLTKGDRLDIADMVKTRGSKVALKAAYKVMVRRTLAAGNEDSKLLQNAINTKGKKSKTQTEPKPKGKIDIDAFTTEGDDTHTGEAETDTQNKRLTDFIFGSD